MAFFRTADPLHGIGTMAFILTTATLHRVVTYFSGFPRGVYGRKEKKKKKMGGLPMAEVAYQWLVPCYQLIDSPIHGSEGSLEDDILCKRIYDTIVILHVILLYSNSLGTPWTPSSLSQESTKVEACASGGKRSLPNVEWRWSLHWGVWVSHWDF